MSRKEIEDIGKIKIYCSTLSCYMTVREYFKKILSNWWMQYGYGGEEPPEISECRFEIIRELLKRGMLKGGFNEKDEYIEYFDRDMLDKLMLNAINLW